MKTRRWLKALGLCVLATTVAGLTGCQTWVGGMTLPSGYYMEHKPQYFPPDPDFPLQKELATMQGQASLLDSGARPAEVGGGAAAPARGGPR
jgi:hypothetical protein